MQHQTVPQTTIDLSHAGVDNILAALAEVGLTAYDNDTDGHTYVEVWLTDLSVEHGPTILSWREPTGWRVQTFAKPEDYGDNKPARSWPITQGSLTEVARDVTTVLGSTSAGIAQQSDVELDLHQRFATELHRIADAIVNQRLPLGRYPSLRFGVVDSRTDLDRWADYFGTAIDAPDSTGIPSVTTRIQLGDTRYGPELTIGVQSSKEQSELERLRAENARLQAQLAEGGETR